MTTLADLLPRERTAPPPVGLPTSRLTVVGPVLLAAGLGVLAGMAAWTMVVVLGAVALALVMLLRLEWAVLVVVAASVFEDYLAMVTPWSSKGLALLLLASWLLRRSWGPLHEQPRNVVLLAALAFLVTLLVAAAVHNNGVPGLAVLIRYLGFLALLGVLVDTLQGRLTPERVARVYLWACVGASLCGLATFALAVDRRVTGPIGDANDLAFFLVSAVPFAVVLRARAVRAWAYDLALVVLLAALLGTLSRGALVGLAAMLVVAVVVRAVTLRAAALVVLSAVTAAAFLYGAFGDLLEVSLDRKAAIADQNVSERLDLWSAAGEMARESPVVGQGPGSFSLYHLDYLDRLPVDVTHRLDVAHNTYLEIAAELGLLGLATFLAILVLALAQAWARWRRTGDQLAAAVFVALLGTAVTATFVTEQYFLPLWLLAALGAAMRLPRPVPAHA